MFGQPPWLSGNVLEAKTSSSTVTLQLLPPTHVCCHAASWSAISCTIWCNWCNLVIGVKYRKLGLVELPPDWPGVVDSIPASLKTAVSGFLVWRWCNIWIFFSFTLLIWATALFLDLAESFVGWYQLVPVACQCQCKSTSWVVSVHWSMCSLNDGCQWWLNLCYFFLLCFRVHEEAAWADEPTGFIATWCNHGASDGPLQLTSFRYLDTGFGRVLWSTPGKKKLSSSTIQRGKSWDIWGFDTHKTKTGALCISSQKISNHGTWSIVFFFPLLRRTFWSRAGGVPGTSWN